MNFTISTVAQSLAAYLAPSLPGVTFYQDPNQQGTEPPCMFLQERYSFIKLQESGRYLRTVGLDLTYLLDYNLPNLLTQQQAAAETLDLVLETFPYSDGVTSDGTALIRTYDREWRAEMNELHYKFEIRVWVTIPTTETPMQTIETLDIEVTNGN